MHLDFFAVGENCQVAGWGVLGPSRDTPTKLQWADVPIRNVTDCRVKAFLNFLKSDIKELTGSDSNSVLTWKNIEKLGYSKSNFSEIETIIYQPINDRMHICAGDTKTDSCQVILFLSDYSYTICDSLYDHICFLFKKGWFRWTFDMWKKVREKSIWCNIMGYQL